MPAAYKRFDFSFKTNCLNISKKIYKKIYITELVESSTHLVDSLKEPQNTLQAFSNR